MTQTPRFGLEAFGGSVPGRFSDYGYKYTYGDRQTMDRILAAFESHDHAGGARLESPTVPGTGVAYSTGGLLPGDRTYYYKYGLVDQYGLETAAAPETPVVMPSSLPNPAAPALTILGGGSLASGPYYYSVARYVSTTSRVTRASPTSFLALPAGSGGIRVSFPAAEVGQTGWIVFRQRPSESMLYKVAQISSATTPSWDDNGSVDPDCAWMQPTANTTMAFNSVAFSLPEGAKKDRTIVKHTVTDEQGGTYAAGTTLRYQLVGRTSVYNSQTGTWDDVQSVPRELTHTVGSDGSVVKISYTWDGEIPDNTETVLYKWVTSAYYEIVSNTDGLQNGSVTDSGEPAGSAYTAGVVWRSVDPSASAWRLYRSSRSGDYSSLSLVAEVVSREGDTYGGELIGSWTDTGSALLPGTPRSVSATLQPALPVTGMDASGVTFDPSDTTMSDTNVQDAMETLWHIGTQFDQVFTIQGPVGPAVGTARWYPGLDFYVLGVTVASSVAETIAFQVNVDGSPLFGGVQTMNLAGRNFYYPPTTQFSSDSYITVDHVSGNVSAANSLVITLTVRYINL